MNLYKKLLAVPPHGMWALISNSAKKIYISYNSDMLLAIAQHIKLLNRREHPIKAMLKNKKSLKLIILDTAKLDEHTAKLHLNYWIDKYKKMGYKSYRNPLLTYKVTYDVMGDKLVVQLVTSRSRKIVVGVFRDLFKAYEFIETYYEGKDVIFPVYANNKLTREYMKELND